MQQDVVELAADQVVALGPAGELLAGDEPGGEAAGDVEHAEGGDEGRQLEADGDERVDQRRRRMPASRPIATAVTGSTPSTFSKIGGGAAGERQHRADREVDVAGGDDVGEPDRRSAPARCS